MNNKKQLIDVNDVYALFDRRGLAHLHVADIDQIQRVVAAEVAHGRWERVIPTKSAAKWSTKVSCSVCHRQGYTHHAYCPHCGAKMDLKGDQ